MPLRPGQRAKTAERGYGARWQRERRDFLAQPDNQFCLKCRQRGLLNPGTMHMDGSIETNPRRIGLVVNHVIPHKGDQRLMWDRTNWEPLCHSVRSTAATPAPSISTVVPSAIIHGTGQLDDTPAEVRDIVRHARFGAQAIHLGNARPAPSAATHRRKPEGEGGIESQQPDGALTGWGERSH